MAIAGMSEEKRLEMVRRTREDMEVLAGRLRTLISAQPPHDLLGYIYGQRVLAALRDSKPIPADQGETAAQGNVIEDAQFVLEYVHAVLASTPEPRGARLDENACSEIFECARKLRTAAMLHAMASSVGTEDGVFGRHSADIEFQAKSNWIMIRGNRYQVLEGEFYAFVLKPHDHLLRETYGVGANEIAAGFQDMADAARTGHANAAVEMERHVTNAHAFAVAQGKSLDELMADWAEGHPGDMKAVIAAFEDLLRGGICNVSRHTNLPASLLEDLSFGRGEETEFYAEGQYAGTPFRTLPARRKLLIRLGNDYYAADPCFTRDAGYRALLHNLLRRRPDYKKEFDARQKAMSEAAFFQILDAQLEGAKINREVWYRDPVSRHWVENDTLIRIDDVLFLVEAKAGAAATIASPALDFPRHVQAVQDLVIKAYAQCKRFIEYLSSADEVPIFERKNGKYVECGRIRFANYRLVLPIGLTIESFSPFATMCKDLPDTTPLLGKHAFLSLSIDDLFVLKRFLPTMGEFSHYLEVRQAVGCMTGVHLFDELDHLGAYIKKNRFDLEIAEQRAKSNPSLILWDGMSEVVDRHFQGDDWESRPVPSQEYPAELLDLLRALNRARAPGWLAGESAIRSYGEEARNDLARTLTTFRQTLAQYPSRYFQFIGSPSLFVWLQRARTPVNLRNVKDKASAAALAAKASDMIAILALVDVREGYVAAERFVAEIPAERTAENSAIFEDAERMRGRQVSVAALASPRIVPTRPPGRNEPCWCGSGTKFKKCHGR